MGVTRCYVVKNLEANNNVVITPRPEKEGTQFSETGESWTS